MGDPEHPVILGNIGEATVYVQDSTGEWHDFNHYEYFRVKKGMNQISEFELKIYDIQDEEKVYFKERATIIFLINNSILLKGRIQDIEYGTTYECIAKGFGMEAKLIDKELTQRSNVDSDIDWDNAKKCSCTDISASLLSKYLLSTNTDGISPWLIQPASTGIFAADYGDITVVFENVNRLKAINTICESIAGTQSSTDYDNTSYEWWVEQETPLSPLTIIDYDIDTFHLEPLRPTVTRATNSQYTFAITGAAANCSRTSRQKDISNLVNYITILGSGDGSGQVTTSAYSASTIYSVLDADILVGDTTIALRDATSFPASGEIRIAEERITYTGKSVNNLTGCTRGANSTTARGHKKAVYVETYYSVDSPATNSSIDVYGLMDYTYTNKGLIDREIMEVMASNTLLERLEPVLRIKVTPEEPDTIASTLTIGDYVTIVDAESSINDSYRIQSIEYKSDYGVLSCELECSNKGLTFTEQMQKNKDVTDSLNAFAQGSSIMNLQTAENLDATHGMNLRFYLPTALINISEALLSFNIANFRSDTVIPSSSGNESATHTHDVTATGTVSSHHHTLGTHAHSYTTDTSSDNVTAQPATAWTFDIGLNHYIADSHLSDTSFALGSHDHTGTTSTNNDDTGNATPTFSGSSATSGTESATHTHTIGATPGITETATSSPYVGVLAGLNGTETALSTALSSGTATGAQSGTTLKDTSKIWVVNAYSNKMVYIISGTGAGQARIITSNTADTLTVPTWDTAPVAGSSVYAIYETYSTDQTSIDISNNILTAHKGNWDNIRFIGNQAMRVEANAYIRLFV